MFALIVDDEKRARESLHQMLKLFCPKIEEIQEANSVALAVEKLQGRLPDILLLDIQLGDGTGFDILNQVNFEGMNIIFTTAFNEYAVKAFKYAAIDYLLKPIDPDELTEAVDRALQRLQQSKMRQRIDLLLENIKPQDSSPQKITLATTDSIHIVNIEEIVFCEADRNYTTFYLLGGRKIVVSRSLREFEELLPAADFIRTHNSYLANLNHIARYERADNYLVSIEEHNIPVSFRKKEQVMQYLKRLK